jgi:hypothetical protein
MRVNVTEPRQASVPSNVEPEAKSVVVVASRDGEARKQKGRLGGITAGRDCLGVVQKNENEKEMVDIQKREESGGPKSKTPIEMEAVEIEAIESTGDNLCRDHKQGQNQI